jgi:hypothetical protein
MLTPLTFEAYPAEKSILKHGLFCLCKFCVYDITAVLDYLQRLTGTA